MHTLSAIWTTVVEFVNAHQVGCSYVLAALLVGYCNWCVEKGRTDRLSYHVALLLARLVPQRKTAPVPPVFVDPNKYDPPLRPRPPENEDAPRVLPLTGDHT